MKFKLLINPKKMNLSKHKFIKKMTLPKNVNYPRLKSRA